MALAVDTTSRDRVSRRLLRKAYSAHDSDVQAIVDQDLADALTQLQRYAMFLEMDDATDAPDAWLGWFAALAASKSAIVLQPDRVPLLRDDAQQEMRAALTTTTTDAVSDASDDSYQVSAAEVKRYVIGHCVRRESPVFPAPEDVVAAMSEAITRVWNSKTWDFRRRSVTLTIASDGSVTVSDSVSLDMIATRELYYTDSTAGGRATIRWTDADTMSRALSSNLTAGRPELYRLEYASGTSWVWRFAPAPDAQYEARCEVYERQPADTAAGYDLSIAAMPRELAQLLKPMTLGMVLLRMGISQGNVLLDQALDDMERLGPVYEDATEGDSDQSVRDVYGDQYAPTSRYFGHGFGHELGGAM